MVIDAGRPRPDRVGQSSQARNGTQPLGGDPGHGAFEEVVLGGEVVARAHPVSPRQVGGPAQVLDYGQVPHPAHHRPQGEPEAGGIQRGEHGQAQAAGTEHAGGDAAGEAAHDREVPRHRVERLQQGGPRHQRRRHRQIAGTEEGSHQAPGESRLVGLGVQVLAPHLPGGDHGSRQEPQGGEDTVEREPERPQVPHRDGWVRDECQCQGRRRRTERQMRSPTTSGGNTQTRNRIRASVTARTRRPPPRRRPPPGTRWRR